MACSYPGDAKNRRKRLWNFRRRLPRNSRLALRRSSPTDSVCDDTWSVHRLTTFSDLVHANLRDSCPRTSSLADLPKRDIEAVGDVTKIACPDKIAVSPQIEVAGRIRLSRVVDYYSSRVRQSARVDRSARILAHAPI